MSFWVAQVDCGDYYCEGQHLLGIFDNEELADKIVQEWINGGTARDGGKFELDVNEVVRAKNLDGWKDGTLRYVE